MKFEFVDFYPVDNKNFKKIIGTVHIYAIDCELDIRGILVSLEGKKMFFHLPHYTAVDVDTGLFIRYPHIRWTNEKIHMNMMNFLHGEVKKIIFEKLQFKGENNARSNPSFSNF